MNDLTTSLLLICAATTFAAGLVVAQRRLVANIARRFLALPRVEQAPLVVAVGVMTVCAQKSGTNGVSNAEKTESQRRGEEESTVQSGSGQETASTLKVSVTTNDIARGYAFVEARTNAKVTFTGDGASNLADPTFIAKAGETNRVTLLIGKSYQATCAFPFEIVGRSSTSIEVNRPSDRAADVCWPVKISVDGQNSSGAANAVALASDAAIVNASASASASTAAFTMTVDPVYLGGVFTWTNTCCLVSGSGCSFSYSCRGYCGCTGCSATGYYSYEGYKIACSGGGACGCSPSGEYDPGGPVPDDAPYAAGISLFFSKRAVIFEDRYECAPGVWVEKNSTATYLTGVVHGGPNGGTATFTFEGRDKLDGGDVPASVVVPAGQRYDFKIKYAGQAPSGAADDVVVRGTFAEAGGESEPIETEATLTSVRVSLTAQYAAPENACASRHVYGVGERVKFLTEPALDNVSLKVVKFDSDDYVTTYDTFDGEREVTGASERVYTCPATASQPNIRIVCRQALYMPAMTIVEPQFVKTPEASGVGSFSLGDVGMGSLVTKNYIGPMTVSFQGVQVFEVPCTNAVAPSGYFATTNYTGEWSHTIDAGAGWAHLVKENNYWMTDSAGREVPYSNWSEGLLAWKIPVGWRRILPGSESSVGALKCDYAIYGNENSRPLLVGNSESAYHQVFEIDANGKSSVTKFGWRLERSRWSFSGDVSNLDKEVR